MRWSVRVRVTAVAVAATGVALVLGGWALVAAVERTELARVARATDDLVAEVAGDIESGVASEDVLVDDSQLGDGEGESAPAFLQVIDNENGEVVASAGGPPSDRPLVIVHQQVSPAGILVDEGGVSARVEAPLPGGPGTAAELQVSTVEVSEGGRDLTVAAVSPLGEVSRSLDAVRRALWLGLPVVVLLVGVVAWWVTGRALRPVEAMRREVEAISHSTLHRRVPEPGGGDEVGRLATTMNHMLDRLESSAERQQRFVADASHELRSPVAALRTELEVARLGGDEAALRSAVDGALAEEARLEAMLADLLVLATVDEQAPVPGTDVDLLAVCLAEAERARPVPVSVTGAGVVPGSSLTLRRVVANLIDNAARHALTTVEVSVAGGRVTVDDDGPGIPKPDRERVFERFTRLDEGRARDEGGAGLGLSLVRAVAGAHGGRAWAEASPLGGARLVLDLPCPAAATSATATSAAATSAAATSAAATSATATPAAAEAPAPSSSPVPVARER